MLELSDHRFAGIALPAALPLVGEGEPVRFTWEAFVRVDWRAIGRAPTSVLRCSYGPAARVVGPGDGEYGVADARRTLHRRSKTCGSCVSAHRTPDLIDTAGVAFLRIGTTGRAIGADVHLDADDPDTAHCLAHQLATFRYPAPPTPIGLVVPFVLSP